MITFFCEKWFTWSISYKLLCSSRLDLLEDVSGLKKMNVSNEEEYMNEMGQMRDTLMYAWKNNKRIESLKVQLTDYL